MSKWDFSGYATRNNVRCSDGRTIMKDAFAHYDGHTVPLLWNHNHDDPNCVLGHAMLENRDDGVYAYCSFNNSESGKLGKELVAHGDVDALSIYANHLRQQGKNVIHGEICELSLVHKGANPGAFIETVMCHSDNGEEEFEVNIFCGEDIMIHSDSEEEEEKKEDKKKERLEEQEEEPETKESKESEDESDEESEEKEEEKEMAKNSTMQHADEKEKTVGDVFNEFTDEQKNVVYALISQALEDAGVAGDDEEEDAGMKHNVFDNEETMTNEVVLSHSDVEEIFSDARRSGSLKDAFLAHTAEYGLENIDILFPDAQAIDNEPQLIAREMGWVTEVMKGTHHTPFSRIKSLFANITEDEARAKGYIKGKLKKEEVFPLLKRITTPTTIYKKQKLDRDDILDIKDFAVVAWLKKEMRMMLDEEIARAILIGDGRQVSDIDKIVEDNIRPIMNDKDLFVIRWSVSGASSDEMGKNFVKAAIKARKNYKGSGSPVLFTTEDMLTDMLLMEDTIGHRLYKTEQELATALRVSKIVTVAPMEGIKDADQKEVLGIIVNLSDYNVGVDRGGEVNMFDDFDIDYNQQKYLIETRCSGALTKPFSAIVLRKGETTASEEPTIADAVGELTA